MFVLKLAAVAALVFTQGIHARVIYGEDGRVEISEGTPLQQHIAQAAATMISEDEFSSGSTAGRINLSQRTLSDFIFESTGGRGSVCEDERFINQPNPGMCSGFLVAPDLLVTAGHCVKVEDFCSKYKWVFGFEYNPRTKKAGIDINLEDVYSCGKVVSSALSNPLKLDYAIVKLDREVKNRKPVQVRSEGQVEDHAPLFVVGSPSGLPLKIADGAEVRNNNHPFYFNANLDTFQGNSGSAVFNARTGIAEGILVRGETDYKENYFKMCIEVNRCANNTCRGEDITRLTAIPEIGFMAPLYRAAESGNVSSLSLILKAKFWVDIYGADKETALMKASAGAHAKAIDLLISKGADVNLQDIEGNTSLHKLVKVLTKKNQGILKNLLKAGARKDIRNSNGETPADIAAPEFKELL